MSTPILDRIEKILGEGPIIKSLKQNVKNIKTRFMGK